MKSISPRGVERAGFYLNYVECKFDGAPQVTGETGLFYLNYVECKLMFFE